MYRLFFTIAYILLPLCHIRAQNTHEIEPSQLEIAYRASFIGEQKSKPGYMGSNVFVLRCGKSKSQYFCSENLRADSLNSVPGGHKILYDETMAWTSSPDDFSKWPTYTPSYREYLYRDLASGEITIYTSMGGEGIKITDMPQMTWSIDADSTKNILGYECMKAETTFRGRHYHAWFSMDIPVALGPWKFSGLPGMILQVECPYFLNIEACRISTKGVSPVKFYNYYNKNFSEIGRTVYLKKRSDPSRFSHKASITPQMELE